MRRRVGAARGPAVLPRGSERWGAAKRSGARPAFCRPI